MLIRAKEERKIEELQECCAALDDTQENASRASQIQSFSTHCVASAPEQERVFKEVLSFLFYNL